MAKYGLNKVSLIGNLGVAPAMSHTDQGVPYTRLRLALTERFRMRDGTYQDRTEWVDVTLWRAQAELAKRHLRKGSAVYIEGRLRNHSWETPQGERRSRLDIEGNRLILLDSPQQTGPPPFQSGAPQTQTQPAETQPKSSSTFTQSDDAVARSEEGDDLPF
jgi:single-strand DNA-binding protein